MVVRFSNGDEAILVASASGKWEVGLGHDMLQILLK